MTIKRMIMAFLAFIILMFAVNGTANAQGNKAKEGKNFDIVKGPNPAWTYVKVHETANIDMLSLATLFDTDMQSIRQDNPHKTFPLCRRIREDGSVQCSGLYFKDGLSEKQIVAQRASNAPWKNCPEADQYVAAVPGETLVLKGVKYMSYSQTQAKLKELQACTDASCALSAAKSLTPKVDWSKAGPQTVPVNLMSTPSTPPEADKKQETVVPAAVPPASNAEVKGSDAAPPPPPSKTDWPFWLMAVLVLLLGVLLIVQTWRLGNARATLAAIQSDESEAQQSQDESEAKELQSKNEELREKFRAKTAALREANATIEDLRQSIASHINDVRMALFGKSYSVRGDEHESALEEFGNIIKNMAHGMRRARKELLQAMRPNETPEEAYLTRRFMKGLHTSVVAFRNEQTAALEAAIAAERQAEQGSESLALGVRVLLNELPGENGESNASADDSSSLISALRACLIRLSSQYQELCGRALEIVTGEGRRTQRRLFDVSVLQDLVNALQTAQDEIQSELASDGSESDLPVPLAECVSTVLASDRKKTETIERYRRDINRQEVLIAQLRSEVESLECNDERSGVHRGMLGGAIDPRSGTTMAPPPMGSSVPPPDMDTRDAQRVTLFRSLAGWLGANRDHVIIPLEHASEVGIIVRLHQILTQRKFHVAVSDKRTVTFSVSSLMEDPQTWNILQSCGAGVVT